MLILMLTDSANGNDADDNANSNDADNSADNDADSTARRLEGPGARRPGALGSPPGAITTVVTSIVGSRGRWGASSALSSSTGVGGGHHRHCHY